MSNVVQPKFAMYTSGFPSWLKSGVIVNVTKASIALTNTKEKERIQNSKLTFKIKPFIPFIRVVERDN